MSATLTRHTPPDDLRTLQGPDRAPVRSIAQRMEALERANDIRHRRAELKRDIKAGRKDAAGILREPPEWAHTMKVFDLLMATPKVGRVKVNCMLGQTKVSPSKTVGGLSERQRGELVALMRRRSHAVLRRRVWGMTATVRDL